MNGHRLARGLRLLLPLLIVLTACAPTPEPTAPPETATELFTDAFAAPTAAWARFDTTASAAYVQQGEFYLEDRGRGNSVYTQLLGQNFADVVIQVTVRYVEGTQDNWMGVLCRQQDEENYYLFAISADGYYLMLKVENGSSTPLEGPTATEAINTGLTENTLEARCEGETLTLRLNDTLTVTHTDSSFQEGAVALFTDAVRGGTTTAAFDDFHLLRP